MSVVTPSTQVSALMRLGRKETRKGLRRHLLVLLPILAGGMILNGFRWEHVIPLYCVVLGLNMALVPATILGKDRQDGTLEFLCGLPLRGRDLALARALMLWEGWTVVGLFAAASVVLFLGPVLGPAHLMVTALSVVLGSAVVVGTGAMVVAWLSLRFRPEHITPAIFLLIMGAVFVLARAGGSIGGIWSRFLALESSTASVFAGIGFLGLLLGYGAFLLLSRAFERCVRDPTLARVRPR